MRPIVHIGYHKTATTWFQSAVYPTASSHRYVSRSVARQAFLDPCGLQFDPAEALRLLDDPDDSRPVAICEENLSGYIHNGGLHGLMAPEAARRIKAVLPDARIVIVIRSQPSAIAASYVQYVRGGGTHGIARYLYPARRLMGAYRHPYKAPRFAFEHFEYDRIVAYYDRLFGRENVIVLPFEALRADRGGFLQRLSAETGLLFDPACLTSHRENVSFGRITLLVGRLLGLLTARSVMDKYYLIGIPGFYDVRRLILKLLAKIDPTASGTTLLGHRIRADIDARFAQSNRRLSELRDLDLSALGYRVAQSSSKISSSP